MTLLSLYPYNFFKALVYVFDYFFLLSCPKKKRKGTSLDRTFEIYFYWFRNGNIKEYAWFKNAATADDDDDFDDGDGDGDGDDYDNKTALCLALNFTNGCDVLYIFNIRRW